MLPTPLITVGVDLGHLNVVIVEFLHYKVSLFPPFPYSLEGSHCVAGT